MLTDPGPLNVSFWKVLPLIMAVSWAWWSLYMWFERQDEEKRKREGKRIVYVEIVHDHEGKSED